MDEVHLERFEKKIRRDPETGCWLWTAQVCPQTGVGLFAHHGKQRRAARVAFEHWRDEDVTGRWIKRLCESVTCVNPEHYDLSERARQAERRGKPPTHCRNKHEYVGDPVYRRYEGKDGAVRYYRHCPTCHEERVARQKQRYQESPERQREIARNYYRRNREKCAAKARERYYADIEKARARNRETYCRRRDRQKESS